MKKIYITFAFLLLFSFLNSCSTAKNEYPPCVTESKKNLIIRFGDLDYKDGTIRGYQINARAELSAYSSPSGKSSLDEVKIISKIPNSDYCYILKNIEQNIIKIQALNQPGDSCRFIEYLNEPSGTDIRAIWNKQFQNYGSREFREMYSIMDSLTQVNIKNENKKK